MKKKYGNFFERNNSMKARMQIFSMSKINLFSHTPKKLKISRNIMNDNNLLLNDSKNASFQVQQELNYFNKNIQTKNLLEKGIPIKYDSNNSKANTFYGSFSRNSNTKIDSFKISKVLTPENNKKSSPISNQKKKIEWEQLGLLNLRTKNFYRKKKIKFELKDSDSILERIKYNKKIKSIHSSFSPKSFYNSKLNMTKNNSSNNFLFNDSLFSNYNLFDSPIPEISKSSKTKLVHKRNKSSLNTIKFNGIMIPNRKIYQFAIDPLSIKKLEKIEDIIEEIKKSNSKYMKLLKRENKGIFNNSISIVDKKKFSKEYQNPFTSPFDKKIYKINYDILKHEEEVNKNFIKEEAFNVNKKLIKDMETEIKKRAVKKKVYIGILNRKSIEYKLNKKALYEKIKSTIIKLSKYIKNLYVTVPEILNQYKIYKTCFSFNQTKDIIRAIKIKNFNTCTKLLDNHKYIVLDFDFYYLTPLHWATKENFFEIVPNIVQYGAVVNFQNFIGDTPLHIGVKNNFYECVCLLLVNFASPFIKNKDGKIPIDNTNDFRMRLVLERIMKIYYKSFFLKYSNQLEFIQKSFTIFIVEEFSSELNKKTLKYFKEMQQKYNKI